MARLSVLDLSGTLISDAGIQHLSESAHLHSLSLRGTKLTGQSIPSIKNIRGLKYLDIRGTPMAEEDASQWQSELSHLQIITD